MRIIKVPVKRHVKCYLVRVFGAGADSTTPLHADLRTYIGCMVRMTADKPHYRFARAPKSEYAVDDMYIRLPTSIRHAAFTADKLQMLGETLDRFFVEQFVLFVVAVFITTENEQRSIEAFLEHFAIDPNDWDYEAARRRWRDHRDRVITPRLDLAQAGPRVSLEEFR